MKSTAIGLEFVITALKLRIASAHFTWIAFVPYVLSDKSKDNNGMEISETSVQWIPLSTEYVHEAASVGNVAMTTVFSLYERDVESGKDTAKGAVGPVSFITAESEFETVALLFPTASIHITWMDDCI